MYLHVKFGYFITYNKLLGYEHPAEHPKNSENGSQSKKREAIMSLLVRKVKLNQARTEA